MSNPEYDLDALSAIGAIIVSWGAIELEVAASVQSIEMSLASAADTWPPSYTDLSKLRSFKERKGHLRALVEGNGSKEDLRALDKLFRAMKKPADTRHTLGHDLVTIMPGPAGAEQRIYILNLGNIPRVDLPEVEWKTVRELRIIHKNMRHIPVKISGITNNITNQILNA